MSKIAMSDLIFYTKSSEEMINFYRENKIKSVELFIEPLDKEYTKKMIEVLEGYEFESISFHGPFRRCRLTDNTDEGRESILKSYIDSFKLAEKYKPDFIVLHSNEAITGEVDKNRIEDRIKAIVLLGKEYGIDIVVENVGIKKNMIFDQTEYENLILENNYSSLIDIGHAYLNEWDMERLISKLNHHIKGYHFHNNDLEYDRHYPMFRGKINFDEVIELYNKYTPDAKIVLEYEVNEPTEILLNDMKYVQEKTSK